MRHNQLSFSRSPLGSTRGIEHPLLQALQQFTHVRVIRQRGFNLHFGVEYPVTERFRLYSVAKYEVMSDLQFFHVRAGWQLMTGPNAPGEER